MATENDKDIQFGYDDFDQTEPSQQVPPASSYPPGYAPYFAQPINHSDETPIEALGKSQSTTGSKVYLSLGVVVIVVPLATILLVSGIIPYNVLGPLASFFGLFTFLCYPGAIAGLIVGIVCIRKAKRRNQRRINWGVGLTMMSIQVAFITTAVVYLLILLSTYDGY
jgi:hypothetical protein